ncbi:MAG TPA: MFS transporter, partial [Aquella sp.]|nr:MFS transporter [Aquella sp.]
GPVIGGFLISIFGWRSIFLLNIPFGLLGLFMASYYLPQMVGTPRRIKLLAQLASIVILGAAAYTFITAGASGWDAPSVKISMLLFVSFTILFVFTEILSDFPMLPKGIFRIKSFTAASIVGIIINFGFYGQLFVLSIYFQQIKNYSALETGFAFLPQAVVCAVTAFFCGKVTARKGPGLPMSIGLCAGVLGFIGLSLVNINTAYIEIIFPMLAVGFGMSFIAPAAVTAAMASAPTAQGGVVSGIISAVRQSGSLMGVAILGSLISHQYGMFASGMHMAFMVSAASYFIGLWFTIFWILPGIVMLT